MVGKDGNETRLGLLHVVGEAVPRDAGAEVCPRAGGRGAGAGGLRAARRSRRG